MRKRSIVVALVFCMFAASFTMGVAYADSHKGCIHGQKGAKGHHGDSLDDKIFYKAHMMLMKQEDLGLSGEQVEEIKGLKLSTKKDLIKRKADIEVIALDIKAALWKDTVDTKAINKFIDEKYKLKSEKAKALVEAYAALKNILTQKQKAKLKSLWRQCKLEKK